MQHTYTKHICVVMVGLIMLSLVGCGANSVSAIEITSWGPNSTRAGAVFNVQPNGEAAFWVNVNRKLSSKAILVFNGVELSSTVSGRLITAGVPARLYTTAGTYPLYVVDEIDGKPVESNIVNFVVSTK